MNVPFLDLSAHHAPIRAELDAAIKSVADQNAFAGGPFVERFEKEWASYCGVEHAIGVGNGTDSLWFALVALGVKPGDEVITVPMTFMATVEAITLAGATPVFVDIDPRTYTMDPTKLEDAITEKTSAVIPVHLFGQCADMDAINAIAVKHGLWVVEDAAQAHGATCKGQKAGSLADAASFSFYPGKNLGAWGEAGAVTTRSDKVAAKIRMLREHGQSKKYHHDIIGWNGRMDGIQAAVLSVKLKYLDENNSKRRLLAGPYLMHVFRIQNVESPIWLPTWDVVKDHVFHVFAIKVQNRDAIMSAMAARGVSCNIHYPIPVHLQPAYASLGYQRGSFPVSEACADSFLSLPMYPELAVEQVEYVVSSLKACLR